MEEFDYPDITQATYKTNEVKGSNDRSILLVQEKLNAESFQNHHR